MRRSGDGDSKGRSRAGCRPHRLDLLDRLWMGGRYFGSIDLLCNLAFIPH